MCSLSHDGNYHPEILWHIMHLPFSTCFSCSVNLKVRSFPISRERSLSDQKSQAYRVMHVPAHDASYLSNFSASPFMIALSLSI